ncbi:MAG: N-acetylmuramoyl-L-alanine amidase [Firmicutes bacterium]|nr:N-acetylmuramoyl-L-alanine amidase [Bacillota bacterium]
MPAVYLSPSTQSANIGVDGISEKDRMRTLAEALAPVLKAKGYRVFLSAPHYTLLVAIRESVSLLVPRLGDVHLALHSNAAPVPGTASGIEAWVYARGGRGDRLGTCVLARLRRVLTLPLRVAKDGGLCKVAGVDGPSLVELRRTTAPAVLLELFFHDNPRDVKEYLAKWPHVVQALADGIDDYYQKRLFGLEP